MEISQFCKYASVAAGFFLSATAGATTIDFDSSGPSTTDSSSIPMITMSFNGWQASWPQSQADASGSYVLLTVLTENKNAGWTVMQKVAVFADPAVDGAIDPLQITFTQVSANAASKILITQENVTNVSGSPWAGFDFTLVGGINGSVGLPHFDEVESFGGSEPFSIAPFTTVDKYYEGGVLRGATVTGGTVSDGDIWRPGSAVGALVIQASPVSTGGFQQFTLLETPLVPEPASMLVLLGTLPLLARVRRCAV